MANGSCQSERSSPTSLSDAQDNSRFVNVIEQHDPASVTDVIRRSVMQRLEHQPPSTDRRTSIADDTS